MNKKTKNILLSGLATIAVFSAGVLYYSSHFRYELEMSDALQIAYDKAGVEKTDVTYSFVEKERSGLVPTYNVDFETSDGDFSYSIDAKTGKVLEEEIDKNAELIQDSSNEVISDSSQTEVELAPPTENSISWEEAKMRALGDAGLTEDAVSQLTIEIGNKTALPVYEVEFKDYANGLEYEYTVAAETGEIIEKISEPIDD